MYLISEINILTGGTYMSLYELRLLLGHQFSRETRYAELAALHIEGNLLS